MYVKKNINAKQTHYDKIANTSITGNLNSKQFWTTLREITGSNNSGTCTYLPIKSDKHSLSIARRQ